MVLLVVETPTLVLFAFIIHNVELAGQPSTRPFAAAIVQRSGGKVVEFGGCFERIRKYTFCANSDSKFNSSKNVSTMCVENTVYQDGMLDDEHLVIFVP